MKFIEKILMASEDVQSYLVTGRCENELADGSIVTIGDLCDHAVYKNVKDMNARQLTAGYTKGKRYGIVDYVGVSQGTIVGVVYRIGSKIAGLPVPANENTRVRIPQVGDEFYLADDNFSAAPVAGTVYTGSADGSYVAGTEGDGFTFKVEYVTDKIMGQVNAGKKAYCTVLSV